MTTCEIERKFLPDIAQLAAHLPRALDAYPAIEISQGYLAIDEQQEVRLRRSAAAGKIWYTQTVKSGSGLIRDEREAEISQQLFEHFWCMTEGRRVHKLRRAIADLFDRGSVFLDSYGEQLAGLAILEIEFYSEEAAHAFAAPAWLGPEVTHDPRYGARALVLGGELPPFK